MTLTQQHRVALTVVAILLGIAIIVAALYIAFSSRAS